MRRDIGVGRALRNQNAGANAKGIVLGSEIW